MILIIIGGIVSCLNKVWPCLRSLPSPTQRPRFSNTPMGGESTGDHYNRLHRRQEQYTCVVCMCVCVCERLGNLFTFKSLQRNVYHGISSWGFLPVCVCFYDILTFIFAICLYKNIYLSGLTFANDSLFATKSVLSMWDTFGWKVPELLNGPLGSLLGR